MSDNLDAEVLRFVPNHYFEAAFQALKKVKQAEAEALKQQIREWAERVEEALYPICNNSGEEPSLSCAERAIGDLRTVAAEMRQRAGAALEEER